MNFKTTLFLVVLLVIVGGFFLWEKEQPETDYDQSQVDQTKQPLLNADDFDKDKIKSLSITKDGKTITIEKQGTDWQQTSPVSFKLNSWSANQPGTRALELTYTEKLTAGKSGAPTLEDVKLVEPLAVITIEFDDDTPEQTFKLGRRGVGGRGYLMHNDDPTLYVVNDDLHKSILDEDINDWRSKSFKAPTEGQINQVTKFDEHGKIQLVKSNGMWAFAGEHTGRVSRDEVTKLLGAINTIFVAEFVADQPADLSVYGLDQPKVLMTLQLPPADAKQTNEQDAQQSEATTPKPRYQTIAIGDPVDLKKERYFATFADGQGVGQVVFQINKSDYEKFVKDADSLRDPRLTPIVTSDITKLLIANGNDTVLQINKGATGWGYGDPKPGYGLDVELAEELINSITDARANGYMVDPKFIRPPLMSVTLGATGHASDDVLSVHAGGDDFVTVIRNNETVGYNVPKADLEQVMGAKVALLRNRTIKDWKPADLKVLDVILPDVGQTMLHFTRDNASWKLDGYDKHESFALTDLLDALAPLKAESWQVNGPLGDDVYTVTYGNDDQKLTLKVDPTSRVAQLIEPELNFMVSQELVDKLTAELRPRTIVDLTRDAIKQVQVITRDQDVTINHADGKFTAAGIELDDEKVGMLFDTLAGLRVEKYIDSSKITRPISVILTTTDDKTINIQLSDDKSGQIGSTFFKLANDDFDNLTAKMSK
ncbi:MAG: hypothetical protein CMJ19_05510 [Phycisphaeraceae bacterium]|nr:hypothetical protein [Phycisphaeraceae bacterium]